ncbi:MAG: ATP-binding cassette domain-containing protein [Chloroflexota bacterium]|nr:ATP-binding cassette domain-containing protein [Chloroflexota bacterium]
MGRRGGGVLRLEGVSVWTPAGDSILTDVTWTVREGEQWALLGPNGAGKSTLLALAGAVRHPSAGAVTVLGGRLGRVDMLALRQRIAVVNPSFRLLDWLTAEEVVLTGVTGTVRPLPERYGVEERARARQLLALLGCEQLAERRIDTCSQGERQRVRVARALMPQPDLLLLDEPATGLDLPAREALLEALATLAAAEPRLATILVTHHLEELPPSTSHALLLRAGRIVGAGIADDVLADGPVSACFGFDVRVGRKEGRWTARAAAGWGRAASVPGEGAHTDP